MPDRGCFLRRFLVMFDVAGEMLVLARADESPPARSS
jgi:hypothetical protein